MKGELDLMGPAMKVAGDLMSIPDIIEPSDTPLGNEEHMVDGFKKSDTDGSGFCSPKAHAITCKRTGSINEYCRYGDLDLFGRIGIPTCPEKINSQGEGS